MHEIDSTTELIQADWEDIELANIRLYKDADYISGRITERWQGDITLRHAGEEYDVNNVEEWQLIRFDPATSAMEKNMIRRDMQKV